MNRIASFLLSLLAFAALSGRHGSSPRAFDTPDAAVDSLVSALRSNDTKQLDAIFGKDGEDILSSGDPVADASERERFLLAYDQKHALTPAAPGEMTLTIGGDDWPFPVPVVQENKGWVFDAAAGREEILNRRIGRNELHTIQVCLAVVDAQREYARLDPGGVGLPVYARRLISSAGKKDGLFWPTDEGQPPSPLGPLVARAADEGYTARGPDEEPAPYFGYRYRLLTSQGPHAKDGQRDYIVEGKLLGGFALVAYPAEYGNSGIMTFIVSEDGTVYQRDLGPDTDRVAREMPSYDPDDRWKPAAPPASQPTAMAP